jgi:hypothetical protein
VSPYIHAGVFTGKLPGNSITSSEPADRTTSRLNITPYRWVVFLIPIVIMKTTLAVPSTFAVSAAAGASEPLAWSVLQGIVTDAAGKPLSNVRVDISTAAPKVGHAIFCPSCYTDCSKWDTTDDNGRFELRELDPGLKFRLTATHPGFQTTLTKLLDPANGPLTVVLSELSKDLPADRLISGVVLTEDGSPVVGALIEPSGAETAERSWLGRVEGLDPVVSDHQGKFSMLLPPEFRKLDIEITADGYCGAKSSKLAAGRPTAEIRLPIGARVTGRILHDGMPAAGMSVAVVQTNRSADEGIFLAAVGDVTNEHGEFEFHHLPPNQKYALFSVAGDGRSKATNLILTTKTFLVPMSGDSRDLGTLTAINPVQIRGRVQHTDNRPLPENLTLMLLREPAWDLIAASVQKDGSFQVTGLPPESYEIRLEGTDLVVDSEVINYQLLSETSFGVHVMSSLDGLQIPVKGK